MAGYNSFNTVKLEDPCKEVHNTKCTNVVFLVLKDLWTSTLDCSFVCLRSSDKHFVFCTQSNFMGRHKNSRFFQNKTRNKM